MERANVETCELVGGPFDKTTLTCHVGSDQTIRMYAYKERPVISAHGLETALPDGEPIGEMHAYVRVSSGSRVFVHKQPGNHPEHRLSSETVARVNEAAKAFDREPASEQARHQSGARPEAYVADEVRMIREHGEVFADMALASLMPREGAVTIIVVDRDGAYVAEEVSEQAWRPQSGARAGAFAHVAYTLDAKHRWGGWDIR